MSDDGSVRRSGGPSGPSLSRDGRGKRDKKPGKGAVKRHAYAHLEHPTGGGSTLCGEAPLHLEPCPACLAKYTYACLVHVQSARKPDKSFCGAWISDRSGASPSRPVMDGKPPKPSLPSPFFISAQDAIDLMRRMPGLGQKMPLMPLCPGCMVNLGRFNHVAERHDAVDSNVKDRGLADGDALDEMPPSAGEDES
jgi:hypothetical protein